MVVSVNSLFHTILMRSERPRGHPADRWSDSFILPSEQARVPHPTHTVGGQVCSTAACRSGRFILQTAVCGAAGREQLDLEVNGAQACPQPLLSLILVAAAFCFLSPYPSEYLQTKISQLKYTYNYQPSHSTVSMWQLHTLFISHTYYDFDHIHFCIVVTLQSLDQQG